MCRWSVGHDLLVRVCRRRVKLCPAVRARACVCLLRCMCASHKQHRRFSPQAWTWLCVPHWLLEHIVLDGCVEEWLVLRLSHCGRYCIEDVWHSLCYAFRVWRYRQRAEHLCRQVCYSGDSCMNDASSPFSSLLGFLSPLYSMAILSLDANCSHGRIPSLTSTASRRRVRCRHTLGSRGVDSVVRFSAVAQWAWRLNSACARSRTVH